MKIPLFLDLEGGVPLAHLCVTFADGSLGDPQGKEGLTRLLVRLIRRSAGSRSPRENDNYLDRLGGSLSPECNRSSLGWSASVIERNLEPMMEFLLSMVDSPAFHDDEFQRLVQESKAEWEETLDDDSALARRFFSQAFFEGHDYGRLVGGTPSSTATVTLDDLQARHNEIKTQLALAVSAAGGGRLEQMERFCARLNASATGHQRSLALDPAPGPQGRQLLFVDKPERSQCQIIIGTTGTHPHDKDYLALHVANTAFGGTFTARLNEEVRAKRGWSYGAYSHLPIDRSRQAFSMWTFPQASDALACIQLELKLLEDLHLNGLTQKELKRIKRYLTKSHPFQVDSAQKRVSRMLDRWFFELPLSFHEQYLEQVNALTLEEVNTAIHHRLSSSNQLITVVGSQNELLDSMRQNLPTLTQTRMISHLAENITEAKYLD